MQMEGDVVCVIECFDGPVWSSIAPKMEALCRCLIKY